MPGSRWRRRRAGRSRGADARIGSVADSASERGLLLRAQPFLPEGEPLLEQQSIALELVPRKLPVALQFEDCLVQQPNKLRVDAHPVPSVTWIVAAWIFTGAELVQRVLLAHNAPYPTPVHRPAPPGSSDRGGEDEGLPPARSLARPLRGWGDRTLELFVFSFLTPAA